MKYWGSLQLHRKEAAHTLNLRCACCKILQQESELKLFQDMGSLSCREMKVEILFAVKTSWGPILNRILCETYLPSADFLLWTAHWCGRRSTARVSSEQETQSKFGVEDYWDWFLCHLAKTFSKAQGMRQSGALYYFWGLQTYNLHMNRSYSKA